MKNKYFLEPTLFIHKETGEKKTQLNIMELDQYRKATEEEQAEYYGRPSGAIEFAPITGEQQAERQAEIDAEEPHGLEY